ncbi:LytR C-terminal domain-containing protein [Geodermatophilus sp. SYSU D00815]
MAGGRRRTDAPDLRRPPAAELSDHPTTPGRRRGDRPDGRDHGGPAAVDRRPPVPPVPPRRVAPQTTVAPFQVPGPEAQPDKYSPERLAETPLPGSPPAGLPLGGAASRPQPPAPPVPPPSLPAGHPSAPISEWPPARPAEPPAGPTGAPTRAEAPARAAEPPVEALRAERPTRPPVASRPAVRPAPGRAAVPPPPVPAPAAPAASAPAPWTTGPTGARAEAPRPASAALAAGLRAPATHPSGPVYGDWTRPSRSGVESGRVAPGPITASDEFPVPAPATSAIPERETTRGRRGEVRDDEFDAYDDPEADDDRSARPARDRGPATGPSTQVRGGRAADRAKRQAVDAERRKELKRQGETMTARAYLDGEDGTSRRPKRTVLALVAVVLVALTVLGVYSFTSPETQETASGGDAAPTSTPSAPSGVADATLPPLSVGPASPTEAAPATPVRVPVTVLNATDVNGLAGRIAGSLTDGGWEAPVTGAYTGGDVATTTVFFTDGDETQRQAAVQLVEQFPEITGGPSPRFFEMPADAPAGLVVVAAGEWQP